MLSKKTKRLFIFALVIIAISGCNKSKNWTSSLVLQSKSSNSIAVTGTYDIKGAKNDVEVGICWDDETDPNLDDGNSNHIISSSTNLDFSIENLYASATYYFRPFIYNNDGTGLKYGEEVAIETDNLSAFENCTLTTGVVEHSNIVFSLGTLSTSNLPGHYKMNSISSALDINFLLQRKT